MPASTVPTFHAAGKGDRFGFRMDSRSPGPRKLFPCCFATTLTNKRNKGKAEDPNMAPTSILTHPALLAAKTWSRLSTFRLVPLHQTTETRKVYIYCCFARYLLSFRSGKGTGQRLMNDGYGEYLTYRFARPNRILPRYDE